MGGWWVWVVDSKQELSHFWPTCQSQSVSVRVSDKILQWTTALRGGIFRIILNIWSFDFLFENLAKFRWDTDNQAISIIRWAFENKIHPSWAKYLKIPGQKLPFETSWTFYLLPWSVCYWLSTSYSKINWSKTFFSSYL